MTRDDLEYCKSLYGTYASLARAGLYLEIMEAYANHEITLTAEDIRQMRIIHMITDRDPVWGDIVRYYKEKSDAKKIQKSDL